MEHVYQLKRQAEESYDNCIICQVSNKDIIRHGTAHGLNTLKYWANQRSIYHYTKNLEIIDRLENVNKSDFDNVLWHSMLCLQIKGK